MVSPSVALPEQEGHAQVNTEGGDARLAGPRNHAKVAAPCLVPHCPPSPRLPTPRPPTPRS